MIINKIVNRTPHPVTLLDEEGKVIAVFNPEGEPIRLSQEVKTIEVIEVEGVKIPLTEVIFGSTDLPKEEEGTFYVVSSLIRNAFPKRKDLLTPNELIRNDEASIVGCRSFAVNL